jgi:hypothetical protein
MGRGRIRNRAKKDKENPQKTLSPWPSPAKAWKIIFTIAFVRAPEHCFDPLLRSSRRAKRTKIFWNFRRGWRCDARWPLARKISAEDQDEKSEVTDIQGNRILRPKASGNACHGSASAKPDFVPPGIQAKGKKIFFGLDPKI